MAKPMNPFEFIKNLQEGIGDGCEIAVALASFDDFVFGLRVLIRWELKDGTELNVEMVVPSQVFENDDILHEYVKKSSEIAKREFKIAEVGEE